jgi:hypothetical protein
MEQWRISPFLKGSAMTKNCHQQKADVRCRLRVVDIFAMIFVIMFFAAVISSPATAEENASNPLAAVNNIDLRYQFTSGDFDDRHRAYIDGAYMVMPTLKLKYELHYVQTDITGKDEHDFEKFVIKPIVFPHQTKLNDDWGMRAAVGLEWSVEFGNDDKGIGIGADQISPFGGFAFSHTPSGTTFIPLLQQFVSYNGDTDVNTTALRLIALMPFADGHWFKMDAKFPYDWEIDAWLPTAEVQLGHNFTPQWAAYVDGLAGIGSERLFDAGVGVGLRFKF